MLSSGPEQAKVEPTGLQDKVSLKSRNKKLRVTLCLHIILTYLDNSGHR